MYIWKTGSLSSDIKNGLVAEKEWKKYYLFISIFLYFTMYLMVLSPREGAVPVLVEAIAMIGILVMGVGATYKSNKGDEGVGYIPRMTALSVPITVKLVLISFPVLISFGIVSEVMSLQESVSEWFSVASAVMLQVVFFWRLNVHIKFINT